MHLLAIIPAGATRRYTRIAISAIFTAVSYQGEAHSTSTCSQIEGISLQIQGERRQGFKVLLGSMIKPFMFAKLDTSFLTTT